MYCVLKASAPLFCEVFSLLPQRVSPVRSEQGRGTIGGLQPRNKNIHHSALLKKNCKSTGESVVILCHHNTNLQVFDDDVK